jgi:L-cystine uptake protein TcyP (sodium:dicarboxylate symporter family)
VRNDFFTKLNEWNHSNSQSTLEGVMKKIQSRLSKIGTVLESQVVKEILEFIPNNPFPAGNLVKCLLSVLIIGIVSDLHLKHVGSYADRKPL